MNGTHTRTALTGATVFDGKALEPLEDATILVEGDRIARVVGRADSTEHPPADTVLDLKGQFIIPGMFNLHDHIYRKSILNTRQGWAYDEHSRWIEAQNDNYLALCAAHHSLDALKTGITTIRDVGSRSTLIVSLKRAINGGLLTGPRLIIAIRPIVMTGGHGYYIGREADGPAEVCKAAREQLRDGADFIKIIATGGLLGMPKEHPGNPQYTVDEIRAAVDVAHSAGKLTTAHADATQGIRNAIEAGIDCIEHGAFLDDDTIEIMVKKDIPLVPTLSGLKGYVNYHRTSGKTDFANWVEEVAIKPHEASLQRAYRAGVRIGVGTDTPALIMDELVALNRAGMTPVECINAATFMSATIAGRSKELGSLEAGKLADLVVLGSDPRQHIEAIGDIRMVMKGGRVLIPQQIEL